jgi:tetratricopeptide (TPR) repeat protein
MSHTEFRVFVSAVTNEFGRARDALASDLRSRGILVKVQSDFRQEASSDTTLRKIHDYIRQCDAVVCVIGKCAGALPPEAAAAPFRSMLPKEIDDVSYTQWEFLFARHYKLRLSIYIASDEFTAETPDGREGDHLQERFVAYVKSQGLDRSYFSNPDHLCRLVLKEDWPRKANHKPIALPYPSLGNLFKGRQEFLDQIRDALTRAPGPLAVSALHGLGGVGKTRAAVEYGWRHQGEYAALLFVVADTAEALRRNIAALTGPLVLNLPEQTEEKEEVRLKAALDWLKAHPGWFLILDNLDTPEALAEAEDLIGRISGGHVVLTTRLSNFGGHLDPLELGVLTAGDATAFLLERTEKYRQRSNEDTASARALAIKLGQLALALEQASAYVSRHRIGFIRYAELWDQSWSRVAGWADQSITKYPRALAATWQTSVNQTGDAARQLLNRLAWFAPDPIPRSILQAGVPGVDGSDLEEAFLDLLSYSMVQRSGEFGDFAVHPLVQDATRRDLSEADRLKSLSEALQWISAVLGAAWFLTHPLMGHALAAAEHARALHVGAPSRLLSGLAYLLRCNGRREDAEPFLRDAIASSRNEVEGGALHTVRCLIDLSDHFLDADQVDKASDLMADLCAGLRSIPVKLQGEAMPMLKLLVQRMLDSRKYAELEPLLQAMDRIFAQADQQTQQRWEKETWEGSGYLSLRARWLIETGRYLEAVPVIQNAERLHAEVSENNWSVLDNLNSKAEDIINGGHFNLAEPLIIGLVGFGEVVLHRQDCRLARWINNYAVVLGKAGREKEAEHQIRRALSLAEQIQVPEGTIATILQNLAKVLSDLHRYSEAELFCRRAVGIVCKLRGEMDASVADLRDDLARLLLKLGRPGEAFDQSVIAVGIQNQRFTNQHLVQVFAEKYARTLADALIALGREADAHLVRHKLDGDPNDKAGRASWSWTEILREIAETDRHTREMAGRHR